ncbi:hypothetical protein [Corynebacterium humireducens]|uniref:hypothetical protein n=1 Tax=Corynebacterium humireducens TaxID=1223514 RepID=UPI0012E0C2F2|nr:hypothetical protein [Corynebacterium humireducens]
MTGRAPRQTISIAEASVGIFVVLNSIYSFQHSGGKLPALLAISAVTMCCLVSAMRSKVAIIGLAPASVFAIFSISNPIPVIIAVASIVALLISRDMLPSTLPTIVSVPMAMILKHPELDATSSEFLILTSLTLGAAIVMGVVILRANTLRALHDLECVADHGVGFGVAQHVEFLAGTR